jgi:uncharacterized repeat protein (TIGR02543 family)
MKQRLFQRKIILWMLALSFLLCAFLIIAQLPPRTNIEYLYAVSDQMAASQLAKSHQIELKEVSNYGIAVFEAPASRQAELLQAGFVLNETAMIDGPPWQSDEDPFLDDQYAIPMMNTDDAWTLEQGSSDVTVAIIDTGIDIDHPEFSGRLSPESYNSALKRVGLAEVDDDHGHGTMVAGIVGANKDNQIGIAGIAQNVILLIIKANTPSAGTFPDANIIDAIYYAVEHGADVINLSLGGSYPNPLTRTAVNYATSMGVIVVAAAGNEGTDELIYPASFPSVVSVSALDPDRGLASYSSYGIEIDIAAPGTMITTTTRNNGYGSGNGTSFAAPQISGLFALMKSYLPDIEVEAMRQRLFASAFDLGATGRDNQFGYGLANTYLALTTTIGSIAFDTGGGSNVATLYAPLGSLVSLPDGPILTNHLFVGWYKDASLTQPWNEAIDRLNGNITLYAKFDASFHSVYLYLDGEIYDTVVFEHGSVPNLPDVEIDGLKFLYWTTDLTAREVYENQPLFGDLTLYAVARPFERYFIRLYWGDTLLERIDYVEDDPLELMDPEDPNYTFAGWYYDLDFDTPYQNEPISATINLYAKMIANPRTIRLYFDGDLFATIHTAYGSRVNFPEPTVVDNQFLGWFFDEERTLPYFQTTITDSVDLYAGFAHAVVTIQYMINADYYRTIRVAAGSIPVDFVPEMTGYTFTGWFYDRFLTQPYVSEPISGDLMLYGDFLRITHTVTYMNAAGTLIHASKEIGHGENAPSVIGPIKRATRLFNYVFLGWDGNLSNITEDIVVYPVYLNVFKPEGVLLLPGIDTIVAGTEYVDAGLDLDGETLDIVIQGELDSTVPGRYVRVYQLYRDDVLLLNITRVIRVVPALSSPIAIVLHPGVSTLYVGDTYVEAGADANGHSIEISGTVDTTNPGVYTVLYQVIDGEERWEKIRYVHVLERPEIDVQALWVIIVRKEEFTDEA